MAKNITASAQGSDAPKVIAVGSVKDARENLGLAANYKATVNGEPQDDSYILDDYAFVTFAAAVKGGLE